MYTFVLEPNEASAGIVRCKWVFDRKVRDTLQFIRSEEKKIIIRARNGESNEKTFLRLLFSEQVLFFYRPFPPSPFCSIFFLIFSWTQNFCADRKFILTQLCIEYGCNDQTLAHHHSRKTLPHRINDLPETV